MIRWHNVDRLARDRGARSDSPAGESLSTWSQTTSIRPPTTFALASRKQPPEQQEKANAHRNRPGLDDQAPFRGGVFCDVLLEAFDPNGLQRRNALVNAYDCRGSTPIIARPVLTVLSQTALTLSNSIK